MHVYSLCPKLVVWLFAFLPHPPTRPGKEQQAWRRRSCRHHRLYTVCTFFVHVCTKLMYFCFWRPQEEGSEKKKKKKDKKDKSAKKIKKEKGAAEEAEVKEVAVEGGEELETPKKKKKRKSEGGDAVAGAGAGAAENGENGVSSKKKKKRKAENGGEEGAEVEAEGGDESVS